MLTCFPSRGCIVLLLILFLPVGLNPLSAQDKLLPVFHFSRLTTANGLPTDEIRSNVVRDRSGFIWIGTANGLARFDGHSCKVYRNKTGDPHSLSSNSVITLFVDTKGRLWVGTYATGLSLYDPMRDRFINFLPRRNDSAWFPGHYVASFMEDRPGKIWIGFADGQVVRLDLGAASEETDPDRIAPHVQIRCINDILFKGWVEKVIPWDEKSVLVSSGGGLFLVNRETFKVFRPNIPRVAGLELDTIPVPTFARETPERLWIGTPLHGLYLLDRGNGSLIRHNSSLKHRHIQELQLDNQGRMWIATGEGVDLFNPRTGTYQEYLAAWDAPGKSSFTRMSLDSTGTLWISTMNDGLYFLPPASFRFPTYALRAASGRPMGMETINLWNDGSYWIEAEGKVANIRLEDMRSLRMVDLFQGKKSAYGNSGVRCSLDDRKGTLWYATWGLGLYSFEPRTGRVRNFRFSDQLKDLALSEEVCIGLLDRTDDTLWIGANNDGLLAFDVRTHRFSKVPDVSMAQPWHLARDTSGKVWVTDQFLGVFVFSPDSMKWTFLEHDESEPASLSNSIPERVYRDPAGRMWIGSKDLTLWEPEKRSFRVIPNATFADAMRASPIGSDCRGRLWATYEGKGLSILDPSTNSFVNFDYSDGLISPISMKSLPDGRVMLVGFNGMVIVHPDSLFAQGKTPRLVISRVSIGDSVNDSRGSIDGRTLQLRHDENVLEFEFAAIDPGQQHLIEYRYRLEGLETSWISPSGRRFVRYPGLAPGSYVFRVKAISVYGRWPDQEIALALSIAPPWWRTWWAYAFYTLLSVSAFYSIYRVRLRQVQLAREVQMEKLKHELELDRERIRISQDMHDEVGASLSEISVLSELARRELQKPDEAAVRIQEISERSGEVIANIGEIIWAINPKNDQVDNLISYLRRYAVHYLGLTNIKCRFTVAEDIPPLTFSSPVRRNIFLVVKEALHNIVKHSAASDVLISIGFLDAHMQIRIEDNGRGFVPDEQLGHGMGLTSMQQRLADIGATVTVESEPGSGTRVLIRT